MIQEVDIYAQFDHELTGSRLLVSEEVYLQNSREKEIHAGKATREIGGRPWAVGRITGLILGGIGVAFAGAHLGTSENGSSDAHAQVVPSPTPDLVGPPNPYVFIDHTNTTREIEFNNWTFGKSEFGNGDFSDRVAGTAIDRTKNNRMDQVRYSLYPETSNPLVEVLLGGITADSTTRKAYWANIVEEPIDIAVHPPRIIYHLRVEGVNDYDNPQAGHFIFPAANLPYGQSIGDEVKSISLGRDNICKYLEVGTRNFIDPIQNRKSRICLAESGFFTGDWRTVLENTPTPIIIPSPTLRSSATLTPTVEAIAGGRGFRSEIMDFASGVRLAWQGGVLQTGYLILRIAFKSSGPVVNFLPSGGLPREATGFTDNYSGSDLACYSLATLRDQQLLSLSDFACFLPGTRAGQAPRNLTYWLSEGGRANFTWVAPGTQTDYVLFSALDQRINVLSGNATSALDVTGGRPACHLLVVRSNDAVIGNSPLTCLIPAR